MQIKGIDISGWQHDDAGHPQIDWQQVREAGYRFCIVKSTQGLTYTNQWLESDVTLAKEAGLLVGCYHYGWPQPGQAEAEAKYALAATDRYDLDLGVTFDCETVGDLQFGYELQQYAAEFLRLISQEHEDAPLYVNRSFLNEMGGPVPNHKLWLALGSDDLAEIPAGVHPWCVQLGAGPAPGFAGDVDEDLMMSPRGLLPPKDDKAPKPAAEAAEVPVEVEAETTPA